MELYRRILQGEGTLTLKRELNRFSNMIDGRGDEELPEIEVLSQDEET